MKKPQLRSPKPGVNPRNPYLDEAVLQLITARSPVLRHTSADFSASHRVSTPWLQLVSRCLPITHALTGLRRAILDGTSLSMLGPKIIALSLFATIALPLRLSLFLSGIRWARTSGSLGHL